ncbi:MAG: hypothetical protein ACRC1R_05145 [Cetobacterium sp.]|uniref:hypothetical protein n=1 Tax=Cetobacterium sp. TaxID=2071632 RepID=UPI003F3A8C1B
MALPKNQIDRVRYFAGLLTAIESVVSTPYLNYLKGRKLGPFPTDTVDYRTVATQKQAAPLLGFRKIEGQTLRPVGFDEFRLTPGIIVQSEIISAMDANLMSADNIIYVNKNQLDAEESIYRDKAYNIKTSIELRKNIMVAQLIHNGEYQSHDGRKISFPIREIDTLDYTKHGNFLVNYRKQLREFIKVNGKRPDVVLVGDKIVDELLKDQMFIDQIYKLGLANFDQDNKNVIIARVLGTQLEEMAPAYDPDLEVDSAKSNRLTLINTSRLHEAYAGLAVLVGNRPKIVPGEYIAYEDIDSKNQTVEFIGKSAFSPVLSDANAVWRIEVDLPPEALDDSKSKTGKK